MNPRPRFIRRLMTFIGLCSLIGSLGWATPRSVAAAYLPDGAVTITTTSATGWACDPDTPSAQVGVHFYKEHTVYIGGTQANPDIGCSNGSHSFTFNLANSLIPLNDGLTHTISAYALDSNGGPNRFLGSTTLYFPNDPATETVLFDQQKRPVTALPVTQPTPPPSPTTMQPIMVDQAIVDDHNDRTLTRNTYHVRFGNMELTANTTPITWNVGQYTGFTPIPESGHTIADYQRSPNPAKLATAIQAQGSTGGVWIDSESVPHNGPNHINIPVGPAYWWDFTPDGTDGTRTRPWAASAPNRELSFSFDLKVPTASRNTSINGSPQGNVMIIPYFFFRDATSPISPSRSFWLGAQTFDLRSQTTEDIIPNDPQTSVPILNSILMASGTQWLHPTPQSALFRTTTSNTFEPFEFRINHDEFQRALNTVRTINPTQCPRCHEFSANPADYTLDHFNLNAEVSDPNTSTTTPTTWAKLGMSYRNIKIALYPTPVYDRVYVRGALAVDPGKLLTTPNTQVFFKTTGDLDYSEQKSLRANMPTGGGWQEIVFNMNNIGTPTPWKGTITGLRIDPFDWNPAKQPLTLQEGFGIDYVYIGDVNRNYIQMWDFNGANPLAGWQVSEITNLWTDGNSWGGRTDTGQPRFAIDLNPPFFTGK